MANSLITKEIELKPAKIGNIRFEDVQFETVEGDPSQNPDTVFAALMEKSNLEGPGVMFVVALGAAFDGDWVELHEGVILEAGMAWSITSFEDALEVLGLTIKQAIASKKTGHGVSSKSSTSSAVLRYPKKSAQE